MDIICNIKSAEDRPSDTRLSRTAGHARFVFEMTTESSSNNKVATTAPRVNETRPIPSLSKGEEIFARSRENKKREISKGENKIA